MISFLKGKLLSKESGLIVLDVNDVGYKIFVTVPTSMELEKDQEIKINIRTILREESIELYGFLNLSEKILFEQLIKINKIGPKLAMNILSFMESDLFVNAIKNSDKTLLSSIPGVGKKTAERLILELSDKLKLEQQSDSIPNLKKDIYDDLNDGLISLGYKKHEIKNVTKDLIPLINEAENRSISLEELFKQAINLLSRQR